MPQYNFHGALVCSTVSITSPMNSLSHVFHDSCGIESRRQRNQRLFKNSFVRSHLFLKKYLITLSLDIQEMTRKGIRRTGYCATTRIFRPTPPTIHQCFWFRSSSMVQCISEFSVRLLPQVLPSFLSSTSLSDNFLTQLCRHFTYGFGRQFHAIITFPLLF